MITLALRDENGTDIAEVTVTNDYASVFVARALIGQEVQTGDETFATVAYIEIRDENGVYVDTLCYADAPTI